MKENKYPIRGMVYECWYRHPEHPNMFVYREWWNKGYGWDCKGEPNINTWWNFNRMEVIPLEEKDLLFDLDRRFREALYNGNVTVIDNKYYE